MRFLWGDDERANASYFLWKHVENPYLEHPLGIVAVFQNEVVGFRGYFATKWLIGGTEKAIVILHPGDTCVHPDHRMKGLSQAMGQKAAEEYQSKYKIFFNLSSSPNSYPGYIKLGFFPLAPKTPLVIFKKHKGLKDHLPSGVKDYVKSSKITGWLKFFLKRKKETPAVQENIICGQYGPIEVADSPSPGEMADVVARQAGRNDKIRLLQDDVFFRWRYQGQRNRFYFYYHRTEKIMTGYLVIGVSKEDVSRGHILDYGESDGRAIERILEHLISSGQFNEIQIVSFGLNDRFREALKGLGREQDSSSRQRGKPHSGEVPLLIRPIKEKLTEADWCIYGFDLREGDRWEIKPISSDGW